MRRLCLTFVFAAMLISLAVFLSSGPAAGASTGSPASGPRATNVARSYLDHLVQARQFSGAVFVERDGRVLLRAGFGFADEASGARNAPATRFRIASLTKQFTAMAVLELQDEGRLSVSDRLCRYVTGCPTAWQQITLAQLLTHTSGIPDFEALPSYGTLSRRHLTAAHLMALVGSRPLSFTPGSRWSYSNTGYFLLGQVIERVSGLSYARFVTRHIFTPLGMRHTGSDVNHPALPQHALGYVSEYRPAPYIDMSVPFAAGSLYSTVGDLARWDTALLSGRPELVHPTTLRQMFTPWAPISLHHPNEGAYGYGWFIDLGGAEYDHDGLINGFVSYNSIFARAHTEIIVLSNLQTSDVRTIDDHLAALLGLQAR